MPIFRVDLERRESAEQSSTSAPTPAMAPTSNEAQQGILRRKQSEESIRTELCEGPIPDSPTPQTPDRDTTACSDRSELIERLKKGESPTWRPSRHFESIWGQKPSSPTHDPKSSSITSPTLLPPANITPEKRDTELDDEGRLREGLSIERPRSALHSGDFTSQNGSPVQDGQHTQRNQDFRGIGDSWFATSPPRDFTPFQFDRQHGTIKPDEIPLGYTSLSSSISSSFVYKPPTSPLVQSESNDDIDLTSPMDGIDISSSFHRNPRRHTLMSAHSTPYGITHTPSPRPPASLRQERTFLYQAHQPRRSLASIPHFSASTSSPQTPALLRSRRPSYSSDISPLQHASMVGSYEESILRGRMSTTPSKPLDFLAQIGVLGLGKCKSSLRCPPHVTLPFPAVFYSYASSSHGRSKEEDGPSPYVGQIDLENGLPNQEEDARAKRKKQTRALDVLDKRMAEDDRAGTNQRPGLPLERDPSKAQRPKRRSDSPRAPPGGSYRIPEKGQIQIIIKNPNKTAVKLFLVPYDLAGMEPGTKTFIRQRSYSAGPIIDNMPEMKDETANRPILRYLAHLHICCPSKGRYYLYKSIRVVFANRVPDGKEKLRNEITLPEPRFTSYKPIRVMHPPVSGGTGPGASLAADKAFRRRSSGVYFGGSSQAYEAADGLNTMSVQHQPYSFYLSRDATPIEPVPLRTDRTRSSLIANSMSGPTALQSPDSSQTSRPTTQSSSGVSNWDNLDGQIGRYDKLNKGDVGYGGNAFAHLINGNTGIAESLLSQRLRSLGVQGQANKESESNTMQE
ncbi:hypothetical protein F4821DRAFT_235243 [Hypoxylon rubiginosum]|uniref:Uncharacterized protein n=1 Tax=Hypoxylon rubiginosum TaxID=110542 RepID=A0ACC0D5C0_9PEZI|nr:hypothetical protein F4821DRAFT_235243 [Hypoxylon rubiginosum]